MMARRLLLFFLLSAFCGQPGFSQKVGLVLSGGGASGIAHIGVIKALEHDSIPIDYITGTSMGAMVGALYAMGYSPEQMEQIVNSEGFRNWAYGKIDDRYIYYFKKKEDDASWITLKLALDSAIETSLPTNLVSPIPLDFALMETFAPSIASAHYKFDSLFIPFRCLASDIEAKKNVIFRDGDLGLAVRASMSYPFYLKPVSLNGRLLYDGGIYNNFPANVMYDDFFPDIIIGSNVSSNDPSPDEDNLISQLKTMLLTKTNFDPVCENGIIIEPNVNSAPTFNFDNLQRLIDSGYVASQPKIARLKQCIQRRVSPEELKQRREAFRSKTFPLIFENIYVDGLKKNEVRYVQHMLGHRSKQVSVQKIKPDYFRLASDDKIKSIYPTATFNSKSGFYDLHLKVKKEKDLLTELGGNFSNRPISEGFIGLQYNYLNTFASSIYANAYFGKLYSAGQVKLRVDLPFRVPIYFEPVYSVAKWDFFKSSSQFFTDIKPPFLLQYEQYAIGNIGLPIGHKGKLVGGAGYAWLTDRYYQTTLFTQKDTTDKTDFNFFTAHLGYEMNSLNRKQYASQGEYFSLKASYVNGQELFVPGTTSLVRTDTFEADHSWFRVKMVWDKYFKSRRFFKTGIFFEGVYSTQQFFHNFTSSVLSAPAFQPLPESKTLFQEKFRAHKYIAGGVRQIFSIRKICDLRFEGYIYQPYQTIIRSPGLVAEYSKPFLTYYFIGTAALVFHTPLGPAAVSANYYFGEKEPFTKIIVCAHGKLLFW